MSRDVLSKDKIYWWQRLYLSPPKWAQVNTGCTLKSMFIINVIGLHTFTDTIYINIK